MPDPKPPMTPEEQAFDLLATQNSLALIGDALRHAGNDSLLAVTSLVMAASRAAGMSGLPLAPALELFASQFEAMVSSCAQSDGTAPAAAPPDQPPPRTSN